MNQQFLNTVAAISTAMDSSGIGIVRMTGSEAFEIADRVYRGKKDKRLSEQKTHTIHYGYIVDGSETVDEVLVMLMRGPHSYTGEDTVEINCHGGVYVVKRILELLIRSGARPAQPGEFTKRAFLNGRLDLSQAEAVGDLIASQNEYALQSSVSQLKGNIKKKINNIRNKIIYQTAFIESALDDPEHISTEGYGEQLKKNADEWIREIQTLLETYDEGRMIKEGIRTVIVGKPNAGKSSLLNLLLGEERAIVTDIAGTTRDTLEEHINLRGVSLNIVDTAGIRDTGDRIEQIGVERAKKYAQTADLILCVLDASHGLDENDRDIFRMIRGKKAILLLNKSDLETVLTEDVVREAFLDSIRDEQNGKTSENESKLAEYDLNKRDKTVKILEISAKNGTGADDLEETIKGLFFAGNLSFNNEIYITNVRHKTALQDARSALLRVVESIEAEMPEDFYSIDLMDAYEALGGITGETTGEDLIDEIFSKFCMGK